MLDSYRKKFVEVCGPGTVRAIEVDLFELVLLKVVGRNGAAQQTRIIKKSRSLVTQDLDFDRLLKRDSSAVAIPQPHRSADAKAKSIRRIRRPSTMNVVTFGMRNA